MLGKTANGLFWMYRYLERAENTARLIEAGLPPSTPALLAEAVSTPDQKLSRHTVESLAHLPLDPATSAPALILYGPLTE